MVPDHVKPIIAKLKECGAVIEDGDDGMRVRGDMNPLISTDIKTLPYPGFPTDMQSQFMAFLTTVTGASVVIETVCEDNLRISLLHKLDIVACAAACLSC